MERILGYDDTTNNQYCPDHATDPQMLFQKNTTHDCRTYRADCDKQSCPFCSQAALRHRLEGEPEARTDNCQINDHEPARLSLWQCRLFKQERCNHSERTNRSDLHHSDQQRIIIVR